MQIAVGTELLEKITNLVREVLEDLVRRLENFWNYLSSCVVNLGEICCEDNRGSPASIGRNISDTKKCNSESFFVSLDDCQEEVLETAITCRNPQYKSVTKEIFGENNLK